MVSSKFYSALQSATTTRLGVWLQNELGAIMTASHAVYYRDSTFQEISWNQTISDRKKELQEKWNGVSR